MCVLPHYVTILKLYIIFNIVNNNRIKIIHYFFLYIIISIYKLTLNAN